MDILPIIFALAAVVFGLLAVGGYLVARDTIRQKGRWGLNTKSARCLQCDTPAPVVRVPENLNQMLWVGWLDPLRVRLRTRQVGRAGRETAVPRQMVRQDGLARCRRR